MAVIENTPLFPLSQTFAQTSASNDTLQTYSVELVTSQKALSSLWNPAFKEIFTDKNDREPLVQLNDRFRSGENFFMLKDRHGHVQGISLPQILLSEEKEKTANCGSAQKEFSTAHDFALNPVSLRPMYVPWVGVKEELRNTGGGTHFDQAVAGLMKEKYGVTHTLLDIEDPERLHTSGYSPEELPEAIINAERRINYWKRQGFIVVTDERLKYVRPSSENDQEIQAYDHMAVRFENSDVRKQYMSEDGSKISIDFIRQCYLDMTRIQYGNLSEEQLREQYPAANQYLTDLDNVRKKDRWLSIDSTPVQPKSSPDLPVQLILSAANQNHPNARIPFSASIS